jgi:putative IMPACT (imprinted ancient) family translation regulator
MVTTKIKGVGAAIKGFGKAIKSFQDKRIAAMNRVGQRKVGGKKLGVGSYIDEYVNVIESKAKNKKQYKAEQKAKKENEKKDPRPRTYY